MRTILILLGNELRRFTKDKTAIALTFFVPVVLIYIFGNVFGVGRPGGAGPTGIPLAVVRETDAPVAATRLPRRSRRKKHSRSSPDRKTRRAGSNH